MVKSGIYKLCLHCQKEFYAPKWLINEGGGKYCGRECYYMSKVGKTPWNKGTKGMSVGNMGSFSSKDQVFKGTMPEYKRIHYLVRKNFGSPTECLTCGKQGRIEWANKRGLYIVKIEEWLPLCHKCHFEYDKVESRRNKHVTV